MLRFRPLERIDSEYNEGWRYGVAVGAAILLVSISFAIVATTIGVLERWISSLL